MDDLFSSQERTLIKADKAGVGLYPTLKEMRTFALRAMIGPGEYWQYQAFKKRLIETGILGHTDDGKEVEYGDITDITGKNVLAQPLTLTNRNLILSYQKGLMKRKNLVMAIPLEHAKSVQEKGLAPKRLEIRFELPKKDGKTIDFDIWLVRLKDRQAWLDKLNQLIVEHPTSDRLPPLK